MNPCSDLDLGALADVPMCEFWSDGYGFDTAFSCLEATSLAHTLGHPIVAAEAFTALPEEAWQQHPGSMKNQGRQGRSGALGSDQRRPPVARSVQPQ